MESESESSPAPHLEESMLSELSPAPHLEESPPSADHVIPIKLCVPPAPTSCTTPSKSYHVGAVCPSAEDGDVRIIRACFLPSLNGIICSLILIDVGVRSCVPPAPTSSTTSASYGAFCDDFDGGLNDLSEDIFSILSKPWVPSDMVTLLTLCDKNRVYVSLVPSYAPAEDHDDIVLYEDQRGYAKVAGAIADDCYIYFYRGVLYNVPANANSPPPFTCITSGRYIGVFSGEDYVPMVEGISDAVFFEVESLKVGERALRNAIERSRPGQIPAIATVIH
ncbi:hypothetical protein F4604DRAFT_1928592 [Suillus subluteus]|nr:hypothetical protein F4604DRAFT_1928592 [Suillus subluteus]